MIQIFFIITLAAIVIGIIVYLVYNNKPKEKESFISNEMQLKNLMINRNIIKPKDKVICISKERFAEKGIIKQVDGYSCVVEYKYKTHCTAVYQNIDSVIKL